MKNAILIHGWNTKAEYYDTTRPTASNDHWFPWLSRKLQLAGHFSKRVMLAQSSQPDFEAWQKFLALQIPELDEDTIIVAHSLGCLAALHYLNQRFQAAGGSIKAGIFAAGFKAPLPGAPELNPFIHQARLDSAALQHHMPLAFSLLSSNDPVVPPPLTLQLGHFLNAQTYEVKQAGHFMRGDGYAEFHEVWELIKPLLDG